MSVGVSFQLPAAILARLDDLAKRELLSRSDILRRLILGGLLQADGGLNGAEHADRR